MADIPNRNQIKKGISVSIETKKNQRTGNLTDGTVDKILTSSEFHPHGIKVRLEDGQVGRVKSVISAEKSKDELSKIAKRTMDSRRKSHSGWGQQESAKNTNAIKEATASQFTDLDEKEIPEIEDAGNEFKEFYQYDSKIEQLSSTTSKENTKAIEGIKRNVQERFITAVCSFGNSYKGGFVYLGIRSDGDISGLEEDMRLGKFSDYDDSFANHMIDRLEEFLKDKVFLTSKIQIKFRKINEKTICVIQVLPADRPIYLHVNSKTFFVRGAAPRAVKFDEDEQFKYIKKRFPDYG